MSDDKRERPVLFSAPMVRALLAGTKTQTRRVVKPRKDRDMGCELACCELAGEANDGEYRNAYCALCGRASWVTLSQRPEYVKHAWPLAWNNSLFRNEGAGLSSELIREAIAATLAMWPCPSPQGIVTFVDPSRVRRKRDPGRCYLRAGFRRVGVTKGGLITLQLLPYEFPAPQAAISAQAEIEMAA